MDAARDWLKGDKAEAILSLAAGAVPLIASSGFPLAALGTAGIAIGLGFLLKKEKKAQPALLVKGDVSCNR